MTTYPHDQQVIDAYLRHRASGVASGNEILLKPHAMRHLIHDLAALGVTCHGITGWYADPTYDPGGVFLIEDWGRSEYNVSQSILNGPNPVEEAKVWCLERLDNGMAPHLIYIGSSFDMTHPTILAVAEAWKATPGPTKPLPHESDTTSTAPS